jgi:hypothetical protein
MTSSSEKHALAEREQRQKRMRPLDEDNQHVFECRQTVRMVLGVSLDRLVAKS